MLADAAPLRPHRASPAPARTAIPPAASSEACRALVRVLADGAPHALPALARTTFDRDDDVAVATVVAMLDAFAAGGLAVTRDSGVVRTPRFAPLDAVALGCALPGWRVDVAGSIASTNDALLAARDDGTPHLFAAEWQSAGRGRRGRHWVGAPGASLSVSFAFAVARAIAALDGITLVCGLAVADALRGLGVAPRLKWPNDVLVDDRKLAGILVETRTAPDRTRVVVGIGLNVASTFVDASTEPRFAAARTTPIDLVRCGVQSPDRNAIAATVAVALADRLAVFERNGFAPFVEAWNASDAWPDRPCTLGMAGDARVRTGIARGVDDTGALRFEVDGRVVREVHGDLSLRAAP